MCKYQTLYNEYLATKPELRDILMAAGARVSDIFRQLVEDHNLNPHEVAEYLISDLTSTRAEFCLTHASQLRRLPPAPPSPK